MGIYSIKKVKTSLETKERQKWQYEQGLIGNEFFLFKHCIMVYKENLFQGSILLFI